MEDPTINYMRALRIAITALKKIRDGYEERLPDDSTVMIDWAPGVAAGVAGAALQQMGVIDIKRTTDGDAS